MTLARPFLSVCMIVKNEEAVLARALASVSGIGAEIIVVDTGSTDRSIAIAAEAGAQVHHFEWIQDFAAARNHAIAKATGAWILILDADEEASAAFRATVEQVLRTTGADALVIPVECVDDRGHQQSVSSSVRMVKNAGFHYTGRIHETFIRSLDAAKAKVEANDELRLLHHGYTVAETARKDRRSRNRALLEASMAEEPDEPRHWHYLGLEHYNQRDYATASLLFERMLTRAPNHDVAAWSACCLAAILEAGRHWSLAWTTVFHGTSGRIGRVFSLIRLGWLAIREGDAETARWCADALDRATGDAAGSRAMATECATQLRAAAHVETAPASAKTRDFILDAMKRYPSSTVLADLLVRVCEKIEGRGKGVIDAMRRAAYSRVSVSAAIDALFRGGAYAQCLELHDTTSVKNGSWVFALARAGRRDEARTALLEFGESCAPFAVVFGLAYDDEATLAYASEVSTEPQRQALAHVRAGEPLPAELEWIAATWIERAIALHEDGAASKLLACLSWSAAERGAFCALSLHDQVDQMIGLEVALQQPSEPAALEVIGLVAHQHGDFAAASTMLAMRAKAGDASVRVYLKAAEAFARLGRGDEARAMIALGREARPHSRGLVAAEALYAPAPEKAGKKGRASGAGAVRTP